MPTVSSVPLLLGVLQLCAAILGVLVAAYLPSYLALRALRGSRPLSLALAPALGTGVIALAAIVAGAVGLPWSALVWVATWVVLGAAVALGRRRGLALPSTMLDGRLQPEGPGPRPGRAGPWWIAGALAIALVPIGLAARRPDAVLERWDALYHLSALERIRETGNASTLAIGSVASSTGTPGWYPGAFHAVASLVPGVPVPVLVNGAVLGLSVMPWVLGIALLARALWPTITWGPFAAALLAALAPASPWDLWVHLSPTPNLVGFAMLPGVLAAFTALWPAVIRSADHAPGAAPVRSHLLVLVVLALAGIGLALLHPNVAVMALMLMVVLTLVTGVRHWRDHHWLIAVPVVAAVPVALLAWTPIASVVTGFVGGLKVSPTNGLGEIVLGLLTVWPMALGVVIALLWWPGLITVFRGPQRWVGVAWIVVAILYFDSAIDSPLNLSVLFYRGQDRLSLPLTMLCCVLAVPGLKAWSGVLGTRREDVPRALVTVLTAIAVLIAGTSLAPRMDNANKNFALDYPGRGRFLQADELEAWAQADPHMDHSKKVLSSPFSGASHMYALHGQQVSFPVAGMSLTDQDRELIHALSGADGEVPRATRCDLLEKAGVGYIYQEYQPYQYAKTFEELNQVDDSIGTTVFSTSHSRLIEVDCD
jgi:hypothetical protein